MCRKSPARRYSGFTLIEVITTVVILAIAAAALLSVFSGMIRGSADPMIQQQAVSIAEAYMEEILLKDFSEPNPLTPETGTAEAGETRPTYDDVQDYNALPVAGAVSDQNGGAIGALSAYTITVTVLGIDPLNGMAAADSRRIDISVDHPAIDPIILSGYRTSY